MGEDGEEEEGREGSMLTGLTASHLSGALACGVVKAQDPLGEQVWGIKRYPEQPDCLAE